MKKKESTLINMVAALLLITLIAGFSLGFVNELTLEPIAKSKLDQKVNALKLVLPVFDNNPVAAMILLKVENIKDSIEVYPAFLNNEFVGAAIIGTSEKGFSGLIKLIIGFKPDGTIQNIAVLEQKETPGLGTKIKDAAFINQYKDKNLTVFNAKVKKDGGEIDALTGATITTRAFSEATQMAFDVFEKNKAVITTSKN
ncbi:MAG: RnfABCDGE type electron transport complex subunit G [Flavobacteriaceae bacterium]|nr:RnfABCDGE type electron transport complex subunit G [Flavobacteriaceae bacterium]